jgi:hypothetical protein
VVGEAAAVGLAASAGAVPAAAELEVAGRHDW